MKKERSSSEIPSQRTRLRRFLVCLRWGIHNPPPVYTPPQTQPLPIRYMGGKEETDVGCLQRQASVLRGQYAGRIPAKEPVPRGNPDIEPAMLRGSLSEDLGAARSATSASIRRCAGKDTARIRAQAALGTLSWQCTGAISGTVTASSTDDNRRTEEAVRRDGPREGSRPPRAGPAR